MDLCNAIRRRDSKAVEQLLKDPDFEVNSTIYGLTSLTLCCNLADDNDVDDCNIIIQIMRLILQHPNCNVNATDRKGNTALHLV